MDPATVFLLRIRSILENAPFLDLIDSKPARTLLLVDSTSGLEVLESVAPNALTLDSEAPSVCCLESVSPVPFCVSFIGLALGVVILR